MNFNSDTFYNLLTADLRIAAQPICSDFSATDVAKIELLGSIFKKWIPKDTAPLVSVAIDGFKASNAICANFSVKRDEYTYDIMCLARDMLHTYFNSGELSTNVLTLANICEVGRAGPGASVGTKQTDFFHKMFAGPLSTTSLGLYKHYCATVTGTWRLAEYSRHAAFGLNLVAGSNLSTAPKNAATNRTICTEPSLNMFYQLGAGSVMEGLLKRYHNIDLSLQPDRNREMARLGSINGEFATIDLKSASDTISFGLVEFLVPKNTLSVMNLIRSKVTRVQGDEELSLNMISSMGNGFTFPLQTLIFATLVRATYLHLGITPRVGDETRNYSVFGDDIIVRSDTYEIVSRVLRDCGFIVNHEKSFHNGPFRESCGRDFFRGVDVRGVYLKEINHESHVYSAFNRLARWSIEHSCPLINCLRYLQGLAKFQPVPYDAADSEGFKCPSRTLTQRKFDRNGSLKYWATVSIPTERLISERFQLTFPDGILLSIIGGFVRKGKVGLRSRMPSFKVVRRWTPRWDYVQHPGFTIRDYELQWFLLRCES